MLAIQLISLVIGAPFLGLSWLHYEKYGHINWTVVSLTLFLLINLLICLWELCLCYCLPFIQSTVRRRAKLSKDKRERIILLRSVSWADVLNPRFWAFIWIDYAEYDPSYADSTSFGWAIDVGNGHSSLVPSVFLLVSMVRPVLSAKVTGIIGIIAYYQVWYGTVLYFLSYIVNRRFQKTSWAEILGLVVFSNGIWLTFPVIGLWSSCQLIMQDSFTPWN